MKLFHTYTHIYTHTHSVQDRYVYCRNELIHTIWQNSTALKYKTTRFYVRKQQEQRRNITTNDNNDDVHDDEADDGGGHHDDSVTGCLRFG